MTLDELNAFDRTRFVDLLGGVFEHSPWVADAAWQRRPFASVAALHAAMLDAVNASGSEKQLALIRAHPELAGKAAMRGELTADSAREQSGAGLRHCSPEEFAQLQELNRAYAAKFGFPFVIAVAGLDRAGIVAAFARRLANDRDAERIEALAQIGRIARIRLDALLARTRDKDQA